MLVQASRLPAYEAVMNHYKDCIRACLHRSGGYECQARMHALTVIRVVPCMLPLIWCNKLKQGTTAGTEAIIDVQGLT